MGGWERAAVALGFFDGVHIGHRAVIDKAFVRSLELTRESGKMCAFEVFTFDGEPPLPKFGGMSGVLLTTFEDRIGLLHESGADSVYAPPFGNVRDLSPEDFVTGIIIKEMKACYVSCGGDFRFGKGGSGSAEMLARICAGYGVECEIVPAVCMGGEPVSSTRIRALIRSGDIAGATEMLGHELFYTLPVLRGRQLGRTIGFPTVNQEIPPYMVHPKRGVYASSARITGTDVVYPAITNIGVKPTVKDDGAENMETHLIGFNGDIYGSSVRVTLKSYIRGERKFDSLDELKAQLEEDKQFALTQG